MTFYLCKAGGYVNNSFAWTVNAVLSSTQTEGQVATNWNTAWTQLWAQYGTLVPTTTALTFTSASTASATFKQTTKTNTPRTNQGAGAQPSLPMQSSVVVTWRSAQATKYGHGRWYLPTVDSSAIAATGYILSSAAQTTVQTGVNALLTQLRGAQQIVILHRHGTLYGPVAYATDLVVAGDISNLLHVQRRRGSKFVPTRVAVTV